MTFIKALDDDISVLLISPMIYLSVQLGMPFHARTNRLEVMKSFERRCVVVGFGIADLIYQDLYERALMRDFPALPGRDLAASPRCLVQQA